MNYFSVYIYIHVYIYTFFKKFYDKCFCSRFLVAWNWCIRLWRYWANCFFLRIPVMGFGFI